MAQKYKVYFANRPVIFTSEVPGDALASRGTEIIRSRGKMDVVLMESAVARGIRTIYVESDNVDDAWEHFAGQFEFVQAAGGLVLNARGQMLFIYRLDKWDLPKGKVEEGEEIVQGALREVEEECSISELQLLKPLITTWHTYIQQGEPMLKSTEWFLMNYSGSTKPLPQAIEGITDVRWLSVSELDLVRANTYPSVLDVVNAYLQMQQAESAK